MDSPSQQRDATYRKVAWRLLPLLMLGYLSAFIDRSNIGFAKLQFVSQLHFSETVYGIGGGLFYLGYCLFEVPSNLLLARIGARRTFLRIMITWSLCSAAMSLVTTASHYYLLRFLLGAAEAGFFPGVLFFLSRWAPASRRARLTALFMAAMTISGIIGGPLAGMIMSSADGRLGLHGWQWLFIVEGLPGCLIGVLTYRLLPDGPDEARWLDESQRALIVDDLRVDAMRIGPGAPRSFRTALLDRRLYVLATMSVALIAGIGGLSLWLPTVIRNSGIHSVFEIGLLSALPYVVAVAVQQIVARRSDRLQERRWHAGSLALLAAAGWFALPFAQGNASLSMLALTATAAGLFGATGPFWSMPAAYFRDTAAAGGIALVTTFGGIASFVSPIIVGWSTTRTGSLVVGQVYYGALAALAALVLIYGTRQTSGSRTGVVAGEVNRRG